MTQTSQGGLFSKEHYDLLAQFEKTFPHFRLDKEEKSLWGQGNVYQSGETNNLFLAYRLGFSLGKATGESC